MVAIHDLPNDLPQIYPQNLILSVSPEPVGGIPTPLKNMKVSWYDYSHIFWKNNPFMFQTTNQFSV